MIYCEISRTWYHNISFSEYLSFPSRTSRLYEWDKMIFNILILDCLFLNHTVIFHSSASLKKKMLFGKIFIFLIVTFLRTENCHAYLYSVYNYFVLQVTKGHWNVRNDTFFLNIAKWFTHTKTIIAMIVLCFVLVA